MSTSSKAPSNTTRLLVGIGSPHGDDCIGWEIAQRVAARSGDGLRVRCARAPADLLDWIEGVERLEICDAVAGGDVGTLYSWQWPADEIERAAFHTSHDLSLPAVLALAETLGRLPRQVRIWGLGVCPRGSCEALSPQAIAALPDAVDRVCRALRSA